MKLKHKRNRADGEKLPASEAANFKLNVVEDGKALNSAQINNDFNQAVKQVTVADTKEVGSGDTNIKDLASKGVAGNKKLYIGIAVVSVAAAFAYWYLKKS